MTQIILGIETSCDDTSVALLRKTSEKLDVLSHIKFGQEESLAKWGGVVPEIAARNHLEKITPLLTTCFEQSKIKPDDLDAIAVTILESKPPDKNVPTSTSALILFLTEKSNKFLTLFLSGTCLILGIV